MFPQIYGANKVGNSWGDFYFLSIIDDFFRTICVNILKGKSGTFEKSIELYTFIAKHFETKLNVLITDNIIKFVSEKFNEFCR